MDEDFNIMEADEVVEAEVVEPVEEVGPQVAATGQVQGRTLSVRSKLGAELYDLIQNDLPKFYQTIRDSALGADSDPFLPRYANGRPSKSAGSYVSNARKMFIDLMKMANADVDVDEGGFKGDIELFKQQLSGLSTEALRDLTRLAPKVEE